LLKAFTASQSILKTHKRKNFTQGLEDKASLTMPDSEDTDLACCQVLGVTELSNEVDKVLLPSKKVKI
jgi:hypothetical protein